MCLRDVWNHAKVERAAVVSELSAVAYDHTSVSDDP